MKSVGLSGYFICGVVLILLLSLSAAAQNITGTIAGTVMDTSGAAVPGATVTITNLDTNTVARTTKSNGHGDYSVPFLAVGEYRVTISARGFAKTDIPNVVLNVGDTDTENANLKPGNVTSTVIVSASAIAPNTQTPENSAVINELQMKELALNTRNFEQLLLLQPGVSYTGPDELSSGLVDANGATNPHSLSVNGLQPTQLSFNFDGADTLDHITIAQSTVFPGVDAIEQVKVLRDSYGAQYGGGGSAQVLIVSKAGGDALHGDAYFFLRNQYLNANEFFNLIATPVLPRPPTHYDDFGFTAGGPLYIPKIYPKSRNTYFFYSEELRRIGANPTSNQGNYPYVANANGYFADPVCLSTALGGVKSDPGVTSASCTSNGLGVAPVVTNSPYPGFNYQIPTTAFSPVSQEYLKDIILPALALQQPNDPLLANSVVLDQESTTSSNQILARIDQKFNSRFSVFFRYILDPYHLKVPDGYQQANAFPGVNTSLIYTYGENFLVHGTFTATPNTVMDFGYSYLPYEIKVTPIGFASAAVSPDIQVTEPYANTTGRVPTIAITGQSWGPSGSLRDLDHTQQVFENTTKQVGQHTLMFGGNYEHYYATTNEATLNAGKFTFGNTPGPTVASPFEKDFAAFLTGNPYSFTQSSIDPVPEISQNLYEAYVQDNWRAKPHFTVQAGVRYSLYGQPYDRAGHLGAFQPQEYNSANAPNIDHTDGLECLQGTTDADCIGTPVNANYNPLNGIVQGGINSPYGRAISKRSFLDFAPRIGFAYDVYGNGKTSLRGGYGIFYDQVAITIPEGEVEENPAYVQTITYSDPSFSAPGAGVNASAIPLEISGSEANWKTPYTQSYSLDVQQELGPSWLMTMAYVGNKTFHLQGVEDLNLALPGEYGSQVVNQNQTQAMNWVRPYQGYASINFFDTRFFADYNGFQVGMIKTFSNKARGAHISVNYTWSKALANSVGFTTAPQNTYDLSPEYGPTTSDRRNIFNFSAVYLLPFFREQLGLKGKLLGGYEISAIILENSGLWQTATFTQKDPAGQGGLDPLSDSVQRPDQLANPNQNAPHTVGEWFNPADFSLVPTNELRPGDAKVGTILGPASQVWNVALLRNFDLPRSFRLQLRAEGFNLFNHVNFLNVNSAFTNTDFSTVTSAGDNRQIQLGAKLYF